MSGPWPPRCEDLDPDLAGDGPRRWAGAERQGAPGAAVRLRAARRACPGAARARSPPHPDRRDRDGRRQSAARCRPATGDARRPASPLGRLCRAWARRRGGGAAGAGQPARRDRTGAARRGAERRRGGDAVRAGANCDRHRARGGRTARRAETEATTAIRDAQRAGEQASVEIERLALRRAALAERRSRSRPTAPTRPEPWPRNSHGRRPARRRLDRAAVAMRREAAEALREALARCGPRRDPARAVAADRNGPSRRRRTADEDPRRARPPLVMGM